MIEQFEINPCVLSNLIGTLPPGRARQKYENLLAQIKKEEPLGGVLCNEPPPEALHEFSGDFKLSRFALIVTRAAEVAAPIRLAPWVLVLDRDRFVDAALTDLASYVAAKNRGSRHWVETLLDEKLDQLKQCGVKAEIREIQ